MKHGFTQRIEGWPYGECVRASYATIFGCSIDEIPRLDPAAVHEAGYGDDQEQYELDWLSSIGLGLVELRCNPEESLPPSILGCVPNVVHLMSGISPRGFGHRCVGVGGRVVFDPHPSRDGLKTVYAVGMLVPL